MPTGVGMDKIAKNTCDNITKHKKNGSRFINNRHAWEPIRKRCSSCDKGKIP